MTSGLLDQRRCRSENQAPNIFPLKKTSFFAKLRHNRLKTVALNENWLTDIAWQKQIYPTLSKLLSLGLVTDVYRFRSPK